jgi:hypothetical protein
MRRVSNAYNAAINAAHNSHERIRLDGRREVLEMDRQPESQHWYDEFELIRRLPRPPSAELKAILNDIQEPQILLEKTPNSVDIVVRFSSRSEVFSPEIQTLLTGRGVSLSRAFEGILWQKANSGGNTFWSEFANLGAKAYRETWIHVFDLCYLGHFHPLVEEWLKGFRKDITNVSKDAVLGRRKSSGAEIDSLYRRYDELFEPCALIHKIVKEIVDTSTGKTIPKIRKMIWERRRRSIHGMTGDGLIFGGQAFKRIPYGTAYLHAPSTWKPRQLATALLSLERIQAYQTVEKKLAVRSRLKTIAP